MIPEGIPPQDEYLHTDPSNLVHIIYEAEKDDGSISSWGILINSENTSQSEVAFFKFTPYYL